MEKLFHNFKLKEFMMMKVVDEGERILAILRRLGRARSQQRYQVPESGAEGHVMNNMNKLYEIWDQSSSDIS